MDHLGEDTLAHMYAIESGYPTHEIDDEVRRELSETIRFRMYAALMTKHPIRPSSREAYLATFALMPEPTPEQVQGALDALTKEEG